MLQTFILSAVLLGLAFALIAIKTILGKGRFRPGHACKFSSGKTHRKATGRS